MPIYGAGTVVWDPHRPKAPDVVLIILVQHPKVLRATSSGETFDNECPARVTASTQHFSRLSFRLTYCCLWISNVQVQACGDAGEHPLESNRMLQLLPWPGAVRLSRRDDRKNCTWAASRIKGAELTAKREKKKQLCTRPKILRRRLEYIQVCGGSGIHVGVHKELGSGGWYFWVLTWSFCLTQIDGGVVVRVVFM